MKKWAAVCTLILMYVFTLAQNNTDSLHRLLKEEKRDTVKIKLLSLIAKSIMFSKPDSARYYAEQGLKISRAIANKKGEAQALTIIGNTYSFTSNYPKAYETYLQALKIYEERNDLLGIGATYNNIALIYDDQENIRRALDNYLITTSIFDKLKKQDKKSYNEFKIDNFYVIVLNNIGNDYEKINKLDSALMYQNKAYDLAVAIDDKNNMGTVLSTLANIHTKMKKYELALNEYVTSINYSKQFVDYQTIADSYFGIAIVYQKENKIDSALFHAQNSYIYATESSYLNGQQKATMLLSNIYNSINKIDSAFKYYKIGESLKDSITNNDITRQLQQLSFNEQLRQQEISAEREQYNSKLKMYALAGILIILVVLAGALLRNNMHKQKANRVLQVQKEKTEKALNELKSAQTKLIQSEKMASLGELTAGIAHEIQNPLNFVNNFSEVNADLIDEMKEEIKEGNTEQVLELAEMMKENNLKVTEHGKRADAIVKGMLEHSRNSGRMEPTDINALTMEYLGLSYHGLRAKDKTFNASIHTDYDETIGKAIVNPQYIGRVLLNLLNNAFYSISEKKKSVNGDYEPSVYISTKKVNDKIQIRIKDNGLGIPQVILDKIYQPFFTTKPTGKGTGLGLSLSYDIITKDHGGDLKVNTKEGEFAEFIITLPKNLENQKLDDFNI
ncbi:MAG TPA: ATP-binding protein [Chitinophagaceae bacterium]|nr:ATP-binding protein [Chitinophagaceae bacterium]